MGKLTKVKILSQYVLQPVCDPTKQQQKKPCCGVFGTSFQNLGKCCLFCCNPKKKIRASPEAPADTFANIPPRWLGATVQRCMHDQDIRSGHSPCWQVGAGGNLQVRTKGWLRHSKKQPARDALEFGSMYECLSCDGIKSTGPIRDIIGRLVSVAQLPPFDGISSLTWTTECPLPRIICVNLMLPYTDAAADPGCSYVCFFHIRPELLALLQSGRVPACVRVFEKFCGGPGGTPLDPKDPNRSLDLRRNKARKANVDSGLLKATVWCEDTQKIPYFLRRFNGKPATITKSGYIVKEKPGNGKPGEWLEIGVDIRNFNSMARNVLYRNHSKLSDVVLHFGFMVQTVEDEDLPEGLFCDLRVFGMDMTKVLQI